MQPVGIDEMAAPPAMDRASLERIADLFKVFGDATRLAILQELKAGALNVGELVDRLGTTQANVSKHLRIMHDARLLKREKLGTAAYYAIDDELVVPLCRIVCEKLNRDSRASDTTDFAI